MTTTIDDIGVFWLSHAGEITPEEIADHFGIDVVEIKKYQSTEDWNKWLFILKEIKNKQVLNRVYWKINSH